MTQGIRIIVTVIALSITFKVQSGEVTWVPPSTALWVGSFDTGGLEAFERVLAEHPVTHLALTNSDGGIRSVHESVVAAVHKRKLSTSAKGNCLSSCAFAFLAGVDRVMLPSETNSPTKIGIHGHFHPITKQPSPPKEEEIAFLVRATSGKLWRALAEVVLNAKSLRSGLMVYQSPITTTAGQVNVMFCDIKDDGSGFACQPLNKEDALTLGIVTRNFVDSAQ